jgi:hypothetical protein
MRGVVFALLLVALLVPRLAGAQTIVQERRELVDKLQASGKFSAISVTNKTTLKAKTLDGTDLTIAIENMAADIAQNPLQRPEIVNRFVRSMVASVEPQKVPVSRDEFISSLRLVIRPKDYLDQLTAQKGTQNPLWRPFAGTAILLIAIDRGERLEIALSGAGKDHGVADEEMFELGRVQLKRFLADMETEDAAGVRAFTVSDEAYSPSLLLLDEPWAKVEKDFGAGFVVAIPDRNTLLAAPAKNAAQLRKAVELVAKSRKAAPMIPELIQRSGNGWVVFNAR